MRLLVLSDLHLGTDADWVLPRHRPEFDVAILAGDIHSTPAQAIRFASTVALFAGKPVIYVAGNHEFFNGVIEQRVAEGRWAADGTNVHFLSSNAVTIGEIHFVGATLWTDYRLLDDASAAEEAALAGMKDHRLIYTNAGSECPEIFRPQHARARHELEVKYIEGELNVRGGRRTVVVTHHAPHGNSIHADYMGTPLAAAFASNLTELIWRLQPSLWIHGHVHHSQDYVVGHTRVAANPRGHAMSGAGSAENRHFDATKIVEIT